MSKAIENRKHEQGFTILELTFVVIIFGLIVAAFSPLYSAYVKQEALQETEANVENIAFRLSEFLAVQGRYPCPAPPLVDRNDDDYGRESTECELATGSKTIATGTCDMGATNTPTSGICIEESSRTATLDEHRVIIGVVPFRQLNMQEDDVFDGYGNQITYAVTENLANADEYIRTGGGIGIVDIMNQPLAPDNPATIGDDESRSSHFILLSHGENAYGAYNKNGVRMGCGAASVLESENCFGVGGNAIFRIAEKSSNIGDASEYDDFSVSYIADDLPYWQLTGGVNQHINVMEENGNVGLLTSDPYTDSINEELEVGGIIRARDGLNASEICSYNNSSECFDTGKIAGDDPDMECPTGEFLVEISNNRFTCQAEVVNTCGTNEYVIGVNADGSINCAPELPLNCEATPVQICSGDPMAIIPATVHNAVTPWVRSASFPGNERRRRYRCNNGTFVNYGGWRGLCDCTPGRISITGTIACGTCQTGTYQQEVVLECPSGDTEEFIVNDLCECTVDALNGNCTQNDPYNCPTGFIPDDPLNPPRYERTFQCTGTGRASDDFGPSIKVPGTGNCICNDLGDDTRYKACSAQRAGFTEKPSELGIPEIRYFNCGLTPPAYDGWQLNSALTAATDYNDALDIHCECDSTTPDQTFTRECDAVFGTAEEQYTGVIPYRREWNCAALPPAFDPEFVDHSPPLTTKADVVAEYCTLIPPVECEWRPNVAGQPPRAEFPGPNISTSQKSCDCETESGDVSVCHKTIGDGSTAVVYNECICQTK